MRKLRTLCGAVCAMALAAAAAPPKPVDVLLLGYYIWAPGSFVADMAKQGIHIHQVAADRLAGDTKLYPMDFLRKFNVVIASGPLGRHWSPCVVTNPPRGLVDRLLEYEKAGGGVVWIPLGVNSAVAEWNDEIGRKIGAVALNEHLVDPANEVSRTRPGASTYRNHGRFLKTEQIARHEITEGVKRLYLPLVGEWSSPGTLPMKFGPGWRPLVSAEASTRTRPDAKDEPASGVVGPAIVGVRNHMAVWPMYTAMTWGNYGHLGFFDTFLKEGDGEKLFVNLMRYLARDQKNLGGFHSGAKNESAARRGPDLSPLKMSPGLPHNVSSGRQWSGLIGARTAAGGGSGTVREYADAARKAGLGFLCFVEDPAKYTPESYAAFVKACTAASSEDLALLPGYGAYDTAGAFRMFLNANKLPDAKSGFMADGKIAKPGKVVNETGWGALSTMAYYRAMPYDPWWNFVNMSGAVLVYDNGKLVDDGVARWLATSEAHSSHIVPFSLTWLNSPSEVASATAAEHRNVIWGNHPGMIRDIIKYGAGGGVMPAYLTNGPAIAYWGGQYGGPSPWRPASDRVKIGVVCSSSAGLKAVTVRDVKTGKIVREWRPAGAKEFRGDAILEHARQQVLSLTVTDNAGKTAIAAPFYSYLDGNRVWLMGDRLMGMNHLTDWNADRTELVGNQAGPLAIPYVKSITDACGTNPRSPAPESQLKIQGFDGGHAYLPDMHISPIVRVAGREPDHQVFQYHFTLGAHDLILYDKVADKKLAPGAKFDFDGVIPQMEPREVVDIACRNWIVRQNVPSDYFMIVYDLAFTFKRDVKVNSIWLTRGGWTNAENEFDRWFCRTAPGAERRERVFKLTDNANLKNTLQPGGYVYQAPVLGGAPAFVLLDSPDPVTVYTHAQANEPGKRNGRSNEFIVEFPGGREFKAGEVYRMSLLMATRKLDDAQSSGDWVDKMLGDFGVQTKPGYAYELTRGKLRRINYFFDADAADGGIEVRFPRYPLGQRLPVRVFGVPENSAAGEYDAGTGRVRFLPVFENRVVSTFDLNRDNGKYYLGAFATWDNPAAVVNITCDGAKFPAEIHNPTDSLLRVTLTGAPGFAPLANRQASFEVPPHETVKTVIDPAPGTVRPVPMK